MSKESDLTTQVGRVADALFDIAEALDRMGTNRNGSDMHPGTTEFIGMQLQALADAVGKLGDRE